jgi:leader peptidase (prepilin peptidase)/N-methyltransferase
MLVATLPPFAQLALMGLLGLGVGRLLVRLVIRLPLQLLGDSQAQALAHADASAPKRRLPTLELLTATLFVSLLWLHGWSAQTLALCGFVAVLVALSAIDLRTLLLPDALTQPLLWAGLVVAGLGWGAVDLHTSLWGAVAGYAVLWSVAAIFKVLTGQDGMGQGDFKLLAAIGAWLGWPVLLAILLLASSSGAVAGLWLRQRTHQRTGEEARYIPFGPFLAGAAILLVLWPSIPLIPQVTW